MAFVDSNVDKNYCLILAGGRGQRLWPCSRERCPKQFIDFFGIGRTQVQQTWDRMTKVIAPDHVYISTTAQYLDLLREQLPQVAQDHILVEPIPRNTAPSMAWANHRISEIDDDAVMIVVPSDQLILNEDAFQKDVADAMAFAATHDKFLAMGVKPTRPEPGYGYIQTDGHVEGSICQVRSFTEKPDREFAKVFMQSGEFLWNTGIYVSNTKNTRTMFSKFLPPVLRNLDKQHAHAAYEQEVAYMNEFFPSYPNLSVESEVLDKLDNVCVMKCDFGWADLGTWHGIYEALPKNNDDNVVVDSEVFMENSHHNVIKLPKDRIGVINGLDGFIVAEKDNVLFICKKEDSSALVRKYVSEIQLKKGEKYV